MDEISIILRPKYRNSQRIFLSAESNNLRPSKSHVFANQPYAFELVNESRVEEVFINDVNVPFKQEGRIITFMDDKEDLSFLFHDLYGYAQIGVTVNERIYLSELLPILVKNSELAKDIKDMISYVDRNYPLLFYNSSGSIVNSGYKNNKIYDLDHRLELIKRVVLFYEENYSLFKKGAKFKTEKVLKVDQINRSNGLSYKSVQHIAKHPEHLIESNTLKGIRLFNRNFTPEKIAFDQSIISFEIEENRILIGFLLSILLDLGYLIDKVKDIESYHRTPEKYNQEYYYSTYQISYLTRKKLNEKLIVIEALSKRVYNILTRYKELFQTEGTVLDSIPPRSYVFRQNRLYSGIYRLILDWFDLAPYDFEKERYFLSFTRTSTLYESYLLIKMIKYLQKREFKLSKTEHIFYIENDKFFQNTKSDNLYIFNKGELTVKLYLQPKLSNQYKEIQNVRLYRNNLQEGVKSFNYYTPDYLIQIQHNEANYYIVLDAKFRPKRLLEGRVIEKTIYKYIWSLSPIRPRDRIIGLGLVFGKETYKEEVTSYYKSSISEVYPFVDFIPFSESYDPFEQKKTIDFIYQKIKGFLDSVKKF